MSYRKLDGPSRGPDPPGVADALRRLSVRRSTAKTQVFSCGCICRTYDGKIVVCCSRCDLHRVHEGFIASSLSERAV